MLTRITPQKQQSKGFRLKTSIWNIFLVCSFFTWLPLVSKAQTLTPELIIPGNVNYDQWYYAVIANNVDGSIALPTYDQNSLAFDFERISGSFVRFRFNLNQLNQLFNYTSMTFNYRLGLGYPDASFIVKARISSEGSITSDPIVYSSVPQFGSQTIPLTVNYQPQSGSTLKLIRVIKRANGETDAKVIDDEVLSSTQANYNFTHDINKDAQYYFTTTGINAGNGAIQSALFKYEKLFTITSNNFGFCASNDPNGFSCSIKSRVPIQISNFGNITIGLGQSQEYVDYIITLDELRINGIWYCKEIQLVHQGVVPSHDNTASFQGNVTLIDGRHPSFNVYFQRVEPEQIVIQPITDPCQNFVKFSTRGPSWLEDKPIKVLWKNLKTDETFGPSETFEIENTDFGDFGIDIIAIPDPTGPICLLNSEPYKIAKLGYLPIPNCEKINKISIASRLDNYTEPINGSYTIKLATIERSTDDPRKWYIVGLSEILKSEEGSGISIDGLPDNETENSFYYIQVDEDLENCKGAPFKIFGNKSYLNESSNPALPTIHLEGTVFIPNRGEYDKVTARRHNIRIKTLTKVYFLTDPNSEYPNAFEQNESNVEKNSFDLNFAPNPSKLPGIKADLIFHNCNVTIQYPVIFTSNCKMWNGMALINSYFCLQKPGFSDKLLKQYEDPQTKTYATFSNAIKAISTYPDKNHNLVLLGYQNNFSIEYTKFFNNYMSIALQDRYDGEKIVTGRPGQFGNPSRSTILDGKLIDDFYESPDNGQPKPTCEPQILNCFFDGDPKLFLPPYNKGKETIDADGNTIAGRAFLPEVGILVKLPYLEVTTSNGEPYNFFYDSQSFALTAKNGSRFWGNTFKNHLIGVLTTDETVLTQINTQPAGIFTNTYIDNAIAGLLVEPFISPDEPKGNFYNIIDRQKFVISNKYLTIDADNEFSFQLNKFPFQAPIIYDEIDRTTTHGILSLGKPIGVKNSIFEIDVIGNKDRTVGFKGNLLSNDLLSDSRYIPKHEEGINNTTFKNLETGIVITNKDYPGYTQNERNYRINVKQNTFEGLTTSIEMQPELFTTPNNTNILAPYRSSYRWELNCNEFKFNSNSPSIGILFKSGCVANDFGYYADADNWNLSGNVWPVASGINRSVTPLDEDGLEVDVNNAWQSPSNWTSIVNENTNSFSNVRYFRFNNEFVGRVSTNFVNINLAQTIFSTLKAFTNANVPTPTGSNYVAVCNGTNIANQVYFPTPLIFNKNSIGKETKQDIEVQVSTSEVHIITKGNSTINQVQVSDLLGRVVGRYNNINTSSFSLPLNEFQRGTYLISVIDSEGKPYTTRLQR